MFNSTIIDVAIGMVLSFLAVSLTAGAITEAISSWRKWREKTLADGVKALLNYDPETHPLALELYKHALINPLASGAATSFESLDHKPAYIDSRQFALAFYNFFGGGSPSAVLDKIEDKQLKTAMEALWEASSGDVEKFKNNIAVWFDNSMDRLSGWYKKRTQWVSFCLALAIAALFNVNVLYESAQIWTHPAVVADLATSNYKDDLADLKTKKKIIKDAEKCQAAEKPDPNKPTAPPINECKAKEADQAAEAAELFNALEPAFLIGWAEGPAPHDGKTWPIAILSWLMVAGSALFGASFWFDILQRLVHVRGTGLKPERSQLDQTDKPADQVLQLSVTPPLSPSPAPQPDPSQP